MLECPHCYRIFRANPEKIGARCPKCRMPLFERAPKRRPADKELGPCARHPESPAVAKCFRCARLLCTTCRTRWNDEPACTDCIEKAVTSGEPMPQELQRQQRHAWTGVVLAVIGWFAALLFLWPLSNLHGSSYPGWWIFLGTVFFFFSFIPALLALGQSTSALRLRGPLKTLATCGLVASGLQLGLMLSIIVLNLWHN
jgi:hypothetical protein